MEVTLVVDPSRLAETMPKFKSMLQGFEYKQGHKYAEFRAPIELPTDSRA